MVRPSLNSTDRVSLLTSTLVASAWRTSTIEELIPTLQQIHLMFSDQSLDFVDFFAAETATLVESHGVEPELRFAVVALNMHMRRLASIACVEEKPKRSNPQHCRHALMLRRPKNEGNSSLR
jgi:hypothetical protein